MTTVFITFEHVSGLLRLQCQLAFCIALPSMSGVLYRGSSRHLVGGQRTWAVVCQLWCAPQSLIRVGLLGLLKGLTGEPNRCFRTNVAFSSFLSCLLSQTAQ